MLFRGDPIRIVEAPPAFPPDDYTGLVIGAARRCRDGCCPLDREGLREAFRAADFVLDHPAIGEELAAVWSSVEHEPPNG